MTTEQEDRQDLAALEAKLAEIRAQKPRAPLQSKPHDGDDARRRVELQARLRRQMQLDQLTLRQAEVRKAKARYETNPWWE